MLSWVPGPTNCLPRRFRQRGTVTRRCARYGAFVLMVLPFSFGLCKYGGQARLVFSRVTVLLDVHFFPLFQVHLLIRFSELDPKWFVPTSPIGHLNGAQVSVEPGKSQHIVVRTVLDPTCRLCEVCWFTEIPSCVSVLRRIPNTTHPAKETNG